MLRQNTINRPLRRGIVDTWKELLRRGEYVQTHQGICFLDSGELADGQHRLTAISEMDYIAVPVLVTTGVPRAAFEAMDSGVIRTASDALKEDRRLVEVVKFLLKIRSSKEAQTYALVAKNLDKVRSQHDRLLSFCAARVRTWTAASCRAGVVVSLKLGYDADYVLGTYRALAHSDFDSMSTIAKSLYRSQATGKVNTGNSLDMMARMLKVLNPANANSSRVQIISFEDMTASVRKVM